MSGRSTTGGSFLSLVLEEKMRFRPLTWGKLKEALGRKKVDPCSDDSRLARVLTTFDLTSLGVGSTLGVGVYVLAGEVSKHYAGPAVVVSFLIAAIASVFAGLCYAEFGARVPKAGSAYTYSYVTVGEFVAFIIGWNLILEYVIGSASVVKGLFTYLDALVNKQMSSFFLANMPIDIPNMAPYPDLFSFGVTLVFAVALALGAKESSKVNNVFTFVNLSVVIFLIVSGLFKVNTSNWSISKEDVPEGYGKGGFAPYGVGGIIKGAATCFYGFIGFDCIATAVEEAKTPQKSIPIAIVLSLLIIFLSYFGISTVLTMMLPYYLQDEKAPFPHVYDVIGWPWAKYIVTAGALCGLLASLLGAMFPLPRIIYAMSSDGLMFKAMGKIHPRFQTPFMGTLLAGAFTGAMSCIFELSQLFTMMSIGTLLAYSMVAACVLLLRYQDPSSDKKEAEEPADAFRYVLRRGLRSPSATSARIVMWEVVVFCVLCLASSVILSQCEDALVEGNIVAISVLSIFVSVQFLILYLITLQPVSSIKLTFAVPFVPWLPGISIFLNVYLMTMLDVMTWIRFVVWISLGFLVYFGYGIWHSKEAKPAIKVSSNNVQNYERCHVYT